MKKEFLRYFFEYIFKSKTRQKLIFLTITGLLISSFSLTVLQGVMSGLQSGLIARSKNVMGHGYFDLGELPVLSKSYRDIISKLKIEKIKFVPEYEIELMAQHEGYVSGVILRGVNLDYYTPNFLSQKDISGIVAGSELAQTLRVSYDTELRLVSPAHIDYMFKAIPRQQISRVSDFYTSELTEIDSAYAWIDISSVQNLIRSESVNKIRVFQDLNAEFITSILGESGNAEVKYISWDTENSTLVWALNLETKLMLFLFVAMSGLIGICITSGFLIFFKKIKVDLASFWILGMPSKLIMRLIYVFAQGLSAIFSLAGVFLGTVLLILLDNNSIMIMPEQFVERNIPVNFSYFSAILAFFVPYFIASIFTHFTFKNFQRDDKGLLYHIRKLR